MKVKKERISLFDDDDFTIIIWIVTIVFVVAMIVWVACMPQEPRDLTVTGNKGEKDVFSTMNEEIYLEFLDVNEGNITVLDVSVTDDGMYYVTYTID